MGTFIIRPSLLTQGGTPIHDTLDPTPNNYKGWQFIFPGSILEAVQDEVNDLDLQALNFMVDETGIFDQTLRFAFTGNCIYLDGSPTPIPFASLPGGFVPTSASVNIVVEGVGQPVSGFAHYFLQQDSGNDGAEDTNEYEYVFTPVPPPILDIFNNGCGLRVTIHTNTFPDANGAIAGIYNLRVEGTYDTETFQFVLHPVDDPPTPGTKVTVTSDGDPDSLDFSLVIPTGISVNYTQDAELFTWYILESEILIQQETLLEFLLPDAFVPPVDPNTPVIIIITSTQFSGSVPLGQLEIRIANGSGIYRIVLNKRTDTLYDRDEGDTLEVKIPNPFIKTAYIGG